MSLALDGELSELERAMLRAHVDGCAECSVVETDLVGLTFELRAPSFESLRRPIVVPRRRARALRAFEASAAVAATIAITLAVGLAGSQSRSLDRITPRFVEPAIAFDSEARGLPRASAIRLEDTHTHQGQRNVSLPDL